MDEIPHSLSQLDPIYTDWKSYLINSYAGEGSVQHNVNYQNSNHLLNNVNDELVVIDSKRRYLEIPQNRSLLSSEKTLVDSNYRIGDQVLQNRANQRATKVKPVNKSQLIENFKLQRKDGIIKLFWSRFKRYLKGLFGI